MFRQSAKKRNGSEPGFVKSIPAIRSTSEDIPGSPASERSTTPSLGATPRNDEVFDIELDEDASGKSTKPGGPTAPQIGECLDI